MSYGINHQVPVKAPPGRRLRGFDRDREAHFVVDVRSGGRTQGQLDSHPAGEAATELSSRRKLSALRILKR
jgi:hypothetical protein